MSPGRGIGAALVVALLLVACAPDRESGVQASSATTDTGQTTATSVAATTAAAEQLHGGTVLIADVQEPPVLNPYVPGGDNDIVTTISQAHMAGAFEFAPSGELVPVLAAEITTLGNGGIVKHDDGTMSVTWTIREEAVWADEVPVSGSDFAFTLESRAEHCSEKGPDPSLAGEVESVGPKTMTYRFDSPGFQFETALPWIVPKHAVGGTDFCVDWTTKPWPSAGPFKVEEWAQGESLTLTRNENYWRLDEAGQQLPYLDRIEFRFIPEWDTVVDRFIDGEIDVVMPPPTPDLFSKLTSAAGVEVRVAQGSIVDFLAFQFGEQRRNEESLTGDKVFRRAVRDIIDSDAVVDAMWGSIYRSIGTDLLAPNSEDVATVADVCAGLDVDCSEVRPSILISTVSNSDHKVAGTDVVAKRLEDAGFDVEVVYEDRQLQFGVPLVGWWDLSLMSVREGHGTVELLEQIAMYDPSPESEAEFSFFEWGRPGSEGADPEQMERVESKLDQARNSLNADEVRRLAAEITSIALDEVVLIPLIARPEVSASWTERLDGFELNTTGSGHTWNIEHWRRIDLRE